MNINLDRSYHQLSVRGRITDPLRLPDRKMTNTEVIHQSWPLNTFDFYISLDQALAELKRELKEELRRVRASFKNKCHQIPMSKLTLQLKDWLKLAKKMEFYHIQTCMKDLFYDDQGLLNLYECGNMQSIYLLSQIQKYRVKNMDEETLTLADLHKDELQIIFRDVCLKISKHLLSQLKNQMYYPNKELVSKLLKFYGFHYDFGLSFQENYQNALAEKRVAGNQESREAIIILFTFKMICCFQSMTDVCYYVSYLKNILLDRSSGVLTAQYETWFLLYETCLKMFSRYENLRVQECIEVDQILSSNIVDVEFQGFLLKNALNPNVSLSSINFYIKNCKKQEKDELKPFILIKINRLIQDSFWKYIEDIFEYIENELDPQEKEEYLIKIKRKITNLIYEEVTQASLYEVEYGLTFILENMAKYIREFDDIIPEQNIKQITSILQQKPSQEKLIIVFRLFNQFINVLYSQTSYESMELPSAKALLHIIQLFQNNNLVCHKSVFKFIYYQLSSEIFEEEIWDLFFTLLAELYFCGGYDENSDLELIHSHQSYRECLASKILQAFQLLICSQIAERKEVMKCLENGGALKGSYFMIRSFKDNLLFESIQNICLIFNSHLSMQTLEFGLNYCTPFVFLAPWKAEESDMSLLSLICEEMPIQTLKFIYKEICEEENYDTQILQEISGDFWSGYWNSDRTECAKAFAQQNFSLDQLQALQKMRRFQFILNISCCVFDKLNENSQKNIKEIKIIYENGAVKIAGIANKLKKVFLEALNIGMLRQIEGLSGEQVKGIDFVGEQNGSFMLASYINKNNFLYIAKEFNLIGKINGSSRLLEVEESLLPNIKQLKFSPKDKTHELLYKQIQLCMNIQASYLKKLVEKEEEQFSYEIEVTKEWAKHILTNISALNTLVKKQACKQKENLHVLTARINQHIKCLLSKVLLPEVLSFLLTNQCKLMLSKHLFSLMKGSIELIYCIDNDYQEHFIVMIEKIQEIFKDSKNKLIQAQYILGLLQLFFELIFNKIRIRSYHLYRIIKYYQKITSENIEQFNTIIAQHIRVLFQEFITNYKNLTQMHQLCSSKKNINPIYAKFSKHDHNLNYIETACTLSMFINLFCRLNYTSLTHGVEKIFSEEEAKAIYIDYLASLTRKIVTDELQISQRDLDILKIDVYGNLNIITQGQLSQKLMNKLIGLAKNLLRVKADLKGVNKLPIKILADKISTEHLEINLQEFEDECKAISLGAISVHKKIAIYVTSNLHLCNIYYVTGRNFQKYIELNHLVLSKNRQELSQEVGKIARLGLTALTVQIGEEIQLALDALMRKLEKYYEASIKEPEFAEKLYSIFKILCISCLNNPEILPLLLTQKLTINKLTLSFYDFTFMTLKNCLPLFCEFYTTVLKTNSGFTKISEDEVISKNLELQLSIKKRLLSIFREQVGKKESSYAYLTKAINYVQQYSDSNRFRFYKFVKITNETYENVLREFQKEFNFQLISISDECIKKGHTSFSCYEIYELLEVALERSSIQTSVLDLKKLLNEQQLKQTFHCEKVHSETNKQNLCETDRKSRENESARSRGHDTSQYKPIISQIINTSSQSIKTCKGKKAKDPKGLRFNYLQEDLININDSKFIVSEWNSGPSNHQNNNINKIMIEKFMLFNEQIENREFLKDAIIFPSKAGLELVSSDNGRLTKGSDGIKEDDEGQIIEKQAEDDIIESMDNIKEQQDEILDFSEKIIQEAQPVYEFVENQSFNEPRGSDSIIYSEIQIENNEDGSMKLFGEEQACQPEENQSIPEEVSKDDIIQLIQDYTLNPEAIKQIVFKIKYVSTRDLQRLHSQQSGQIAYVIQAELRSRGIMLPPETNNYEFFFMDESKIYERLRNNRRNEEKEKEIIIPQFSNQFLKEWFKIIFKAANEDKLASFSKRISNFCRRMLLDLNNVQLLISETLKMMSMDNNQFQLKYQDYVTFSKKFTPEFYKQVLADQVFGLMVEFRIALPIIFYGYWDAKIMKIVPKSSVNDTKTEAIIQIILSCLLRSSQKESSFLKNLLEYTETLSKTTRYNYPYFQIQDSLTLSKKIIEQLSEKMHLTSETFTDNDKYFKIFRVMFFLQVKTYQEFLRIELAKITEVVKKSYAKEDNVMQIFRKNYSAEEGLEIERKAEIYWQLRKSKNTDEYNSQLIYCRRIFTDLASVVLDRLKETCFSHYYKGEELSMKEELLYIKRKMNETRNYSQKYELQTEFKEKEKRYAFWKRNLINLIIVEEIGPAVEQVSGDFLDQIKQTTELLSELYSNFSEISKTTPIVFKQCAEYYKLMLAYQLLKKEEEQTFHSMSTLKTIPSIQSTRQMDGARRRSSLNNRHSILQIGSIIDVSSILKKSAAMFTMDSLAMETSNPLFGMHAKNADMQTKLRYLKQENKLGEKTIEVNRENMWMSTAAHLDDNFGNYDIKIKIAGEIGMDYGGVTREWLGTVVKEILDPRLGLFQLNVNQLAFQPSKLSYLVPNHLDMFYKFGILVGKAMKENWLLELNFTKSFLKHMLGALLYVEDLEDIEPDTAKGLLWILKNYVDEDLGLNFTYDQTILESKRTVELVPGGTEVYVNEMNKKQYVKKLAYTKMTESIREQSLAFISGVQKVISIQMLKLFNYREIGKYFAGVSIINVFEMKEYAKYEGYSEDNENIQWFWEVMETRSEEDKAEFLFFLTGSYRVPYSGFKDNPITINKMAGCKDYLPVAHTCFSIIDLPEYSSKDKLDKMITRAVKEGKGFTVS